MTKASYAFKLIGNRVLVFFNLDYIFIRIKQKQP